MTDEVLDNLRLCPSAAGSDMPREVVAMTLFPAALNARFRTSSTVRARIQTEIGRD
jgi:hypothetical protein